MGGWCCTNLVGDCAAVVGDSATFNAGVDDSSLSFAGAEARRSRCLAANVSSWEIFGTDAANRSFVGDNFLAVVESNRRLVGGEPAADSRRSLAANACVSPPQLLAPLTSTL